MTLAGACGSLMAGLIREHRDPAGRPAQLHPGRPAQTKLLLSWDG